MSATLEDLRREHIKAFDDWEDAAAKANQLKEVEVDARLALLEAEEAAWTGAGVAEVLTLREILAVCEESFHGSTYEWAQQAGLKLSKVVGIVKGRLAEIEAKARTDRPPDDPKLGATERVQAGKPC